MAKEKEFKYEIKEQLDLLSENPDGKTCEVNLISYNGGETKLDIRRWFVDKEGNKKMGKGITLNGEEAELLLNALESIENFDF